MQVPHRNPKNINNLQTKVVITMRQLFCLSLALLVAISLVSSNAFCATSQSQPEFRGLDLTTGKDLQFQPAAKSLGTVVVFLSSKCGCTRLHMKYIKDLANQFPEFSYIGVNSNLDEELSESQKYFSEEPVGFSVLRDEKQKLANHFGALKTPHAFVLNPAGQKIFSGGVTSSSNPKEAEKLFLRDTLVALKAGQKPPLEVARAIGCEIKRN